MSLRPKYANCSSAGCLLEKKQKPRRRYGGIAHPKLQGAWRIHGIRWESRQMKGNHDYHFNGKAGKVKDGFLAYEQSRLLGAATPPIVWLTSIWNNIHHQHTTHHFIVRSPNHWKTHKKHLWTIGWCLVGTSRELVCLYRKSVDHEGKVYTFARESLQLKKLMSPKPTYANCLLSPICPYVGVETGMMILRRVQECNGAVVIHLALTRNTEITWFPR